ncbi:MAG TPA: DUF3606 domain-containing protein [Burkholderiaceae bacterium]|nr:DUF3606 domain-containing protein [Burkholderiaceae bacterium]
MEQQRQSSSSGRGTIDINNSGDVEHWTRELSISREELAKVVELAGSQVDAVVEYVRQWGRPATTE